MTRVYSTDDGDLRKGGRRQRAGAAAAPGAAQGHPSDGVVRVERRRGGRGSGWVTLVTGLPGDPKAALKDLKRLVGSGGAVRGSALELQGDHADALVDHLTRQGHRVRRAGG
ncbi:MAG: stress response translation initiation inhibitor YciH [Gaiellales bacterium]